MLDLVASLQWVRENITSFGGDPARVMIFGQSGVGAGTFSPVMDGTVLPHHPFDPAAPPESADVPVVISTTLEDAALSLTNFDLDEAGLRKMMTERYGASAGPMLALYRRRYPNKSPYLIQAQIATDARSITSATASAGPDQPGSAPCGTGSLRPGCPWRRRRTRTIPKFRTGPPTIRRRGPP